jgi:RES domain-containing protein
MAARPTVRRSGPYFRVVAPDWIDPADTSFSKQRGGRWNPPGEFGALYLNASVAVAAANARTQHAGRAIKLFDLLPKARPELVTFEVPTVTVLDACTPKTAGALGLPDSFPFAILWPPCQAIAREAYLNGLAGVAARSNAEVTATSCVGEELALFDRPTRVVSQTERRRFNAWYPDPIPG